MSDEKISQMGSAGSLDGTELVPIVRLGVLNVNLATTPRALATFLTLLVELGNLTT